LQLTNVSDFEFIQTHSQNPRGLLYRNGSRLFGTGYNNYGQLGNNSTTNASVFVQAQLPISVVFDPETSMVAANDNALFVYAGGKLYYTGMSPNGTVTGTWTLSEYQLPQI
jgi:alpha-tubulin suppressor-like RCC1 family protein